MFRPALETVVPINIQKYRRHPKRSVSFLPVDITQLEVGALVAVFDYGAGKVRDDDFGDERPDECIDEPCS